jgi:hypothetical protein
MGGIVEVLIQSLIAIGIILMTYNVIRVLDFARRRQDMIVGKREKLLTGVVFALIVSFDITYVVIFMQSLNQLSIGLILSGEVFALLSTLLGVIAYHILKNNIRPGIFLPLLLAVPTLILLLPNEFLDVIFTYSPSVVSGKELFALWAGAIKAFANNMLLGIGIGKESFISEMAALGIFGHSNSSNLFIELGLEAGIPALVCFLLMLAVRLRHRALSFTYVKNSQFGMMANLSGTCLFILLAFGMVNYIWSEPTAYYLFWCIFGIGSATLRASKKDYRERVVYYEESSAYDSSVIDIEIG